MFVLGVVFGICLSYRSFKRSKIKTDLSKGETEVEHDSVDSSVLGNNKLILIVRNDLKMGKGKVAAQCSHAAVMAHESSRKKKPQIFADWKNFGQPKIVVKVR